MNTHAGDWLEARAAVTPDALALETGAQRFTWGELAQRARAASENLRAVGVRAGERVGLWLPPGAEFVTALHAIWRLGAIAAPVNLRLPEAQAWAQLTALTPRVVLRANANTPEPFTKIAPPAARAQITNTPTPSRAQDAVALILFTSGTAGAPKAACLQFSNLEASARAAARVLGGGARTRWLLCLPLFHIGGLSILVRAVVTGAAVVLHARFDAHQVSRALDDDGITAVSLVPTTLARVLEARGARRAPPTLRTVLLGGAACSPSLLARAHAAGFPVRASYGLTETASQIATAAPPVPPIPYDSEAPAVGTAAGADGVTADPADVAAAVAVTADAVTAAAGSAGVAATTVTTTDDDAYSLHALPGSALRVVGSAGRVLGAGETGEIQVRGPTVFAGYWNDAPATRAVFAGAWLRTGDLGALDARGRLRVAGRRDDLIITGGENVHPAQVEAALLAHALVAEAAVAARPDSDLGQRVAAWVVARAGAAPNTPTLRAHCRARLAGYAQPREIFWVDALPRNALGKVQRRLLVAKPDAKVNAAK